MKLGWLFFELLVQMCLDVGERVAALNLDLSVLEQVLVQVGADDNSATATSAAITTVVVDLALLALASELKLCESDRVRVFLDQLSTQFESLYNNKSLVQ